MNSMPVTFEEAVDFVYRTFSKQELSPMCRYGTGMKIRNELGLWGDSSLRTHMTERFGLGHADDMGSLIIAAARAKHSNKEYDPTEDIAYCKAHWRAVNTDPKTLERFHVEKIPLGAATRG